MLHNTINIAILFFVYWIKEFRKTQSDDSNSEKKSISSSDKKE